MPAAIAEVFQLVVKIGLAFASNAREIHFIGGAPDGGCAASAMACGAGLHALGGGLRERRVAYKKCKCKNKRENRFHSCDRTAEGKTARNQGQYSRYRVLVAAPRFECSA